MWILISARLRRWLLAAVALSLITTAVRTLRTRLEARSGSTGLSRSLRRVENVTGRMGRRRSRDDDGVETAR